MRLTVKGVEHVFDDNGVCQLHGENCSMAGADPRDYGRNAETENARRARQAAELGEAVADSPNRGLWKPSTLKAGYKIPIAETIPTVYVEVYPANPDGFWLDTIDSDGEPYRKRFGSAKEATDEADLISTATYS